MKRNIFTIITILIAIIGLFSCEREEIPNQEKDIPDGYIPISFTFSAPDMIQANTKAVDPDGKGVNSMVLFCFDNFGMFITYVEVSSSEITPDGSYPYLKGSIRETLIPENTRRIHFVGNQNMTSFEEGAFIGKSEREVIAELEGSSGMMVYWGYYAPDPENSDITDSESFKAALNAAHGNSNTPLRMLRNQARFTVPDAEGKFDVTGFTVVNTNAFGTVAPYHPHKGFGFTMTTSVNNGTETWSDCDWTKDDFITLPANTTRLSPPADVDIADETCVFETNNNSAQPVSIIIKGKNNGETEEKYYRVILMDAEGNYVKVRRNFHYTINITGALSFGQRTFAEALTAPATNNIWLSIDDEVKEVSDGTYTLNVNETSVIIMAKNVNTGTADYPVWNLELFKPTANADYDLQDNELYLGYTISKTNEALTAGDKPEVSWVEGSSVSTQPVLNAYNVNLQSNNTISTEVEVILDNLSALADVSQIEGTVLIKKGVLQRKIKIIVVKQMRFTPVWVSTQVNKDAGENVNLLFTVPESCPDELLPFKVYVSVNHLDVRNTSGRTFPIITKISDPENYGEDTYSQYTAGVGTGDPIGYKYVYTVTQKGDQRMYFNNLIHRDDEASEYITIESPYFETVHKVFTFNNATEYRIEVPQLQIYNPTSSSAGNSSGNVSQFSPDEQIKYILVPQKKGAAVDLGIALVHKDGENYNDIQAGTNDEFFLYSENLQHPTHDGSCSCVIKEFDRVHWGTGGRIQAFKFTGNASDIGNGRNGYTLKLVTTKANSEEVIRISSNHTGSAAAFTNGTYSGNQYRSIIFELANYKAFEFGSKIGIGSTVYNIGQTVSVPYNPNTDISLQFYVQSYTSSTDSKTVSPFGTQFYVYIVAPMLKQADGAGYILLDETKGVFAYPIAANADNRHYTLNFKKKGVVSDGEILITTDPVLAGVSNISGHGEQIVNFNNETFALSSTKITGEIELKRDETPSPLHDGAFVSFALTKNNSRIGSMDVYIENGTSRYTLTLRKEYSFNWDDEIKITHTHTEDSVNETFICSTETRKPANDPTYKFTLADLYDNSKITLVKQQ